jgi:5-(carboxyamino)imidazole ribonucleotide synthase
VTSQFEQQARILAGLPLGATGLLVPAAMLNLLGDCWYEPSPEQGAGAVDPDWAAVLSESTAKLYLYGKRAARPGRKMGHVTVLGIDGVDAPLTLIQIAQRLGASH